MNTAEIFEFPGQPPGSLSPVISGKGFALIHRQFMDSKLYKDSQAVHLWIHLILKANHADEPVETEFGVITVRRGQMITGRPTLVMETFIPDNKVRSLLRTFEAKGMIKTESKGRKFSLLTIVKYDDFQALNCPTVVQGLSINNNNILNTNVFNDRPRKSNPLPDKPKPIKPEAAIQSPKGDQPKSGYKARCMIAPQRCGAFLFTQQVRILKCPVRRWQLVRAVPPVSILTVVVNAQADALLRYCVLNCYLKD